MQIWELSMVLVVTAVAITMTMVTSMFLVVTIFLMVPVSSTMLVSLVLVALAPIIRDLAVTTKVNAKAVLMSGHEHLRYHCFCFVFSARVGLKAKVPEE